MTGQERSELTSINAIRTLAMVAAQAANSGHPGTAMAPVVYCLWQRFLRFDPNDPIWPNRDRFVLYIGHASTLLHAMLHLSGVKAVNPKYETLGEPSVSLDDIKGFRQLDSNCPGHPEYRWTSGVETTTGPLGQGVATSVGMAIASKWQAADFNRPDFAMFNYNVYALCGDGCMMEGVTGGAVSLAGHLKLSNLCWIYDNNKITIEGHTDWAFSEDVATRFIGYGWNVTRVGNANDLDMLERSFQTFENTSDRPTLVIVDSHIAFGSPNKQDTHAAQGAPLGEDEIKVTKRNYGWPEDEKFLVPDDVYENFQKGMGSRGKNLREAWMSIFDDYRKAYPELADNLYKMQHRDLPDGWGADIPTFTAEHPSGRNFHFGVREHAMGSVLNGLSLSKIRPYGSGFVIFSDYARPAVHLSALMELPTISVFTHDSIGVGEDGPTHQPIEHLASLRAIPGLITLRPPDANEIAEDWRVIMQLKHEPVALILSRQALPTLDRQKYESAAGVAQGAYILTDATDGQPDILLLGTGSEVGLCIEAYEQLSAEGIKPRVVSMPSWEFFEQQEQAYRDRVLPPEITARIGVEQAGIFGWHRYVGPTGEIVGMQTFGASAPLKELQKKFGFTAEHVVVRAKDLLAQQNSGPELRLASNA